MISTLQTRSPQAFFEALCRAERWRIGMIQGDLLSIVGPSEHLILCENLWWPLTTLSIPWLPSLPTHRWPDRISTELLRRSSSDKPSWRIVGSSSSETGAFATFQTVNVRHCDLAEVTRIIRWMTSEIAWLETLSKTCQADDPVDLR